MSGRPHRPFGSGDGWVELDDGRRFWGLGGAAGLVVVSPAGTTLLQHRVEWSHFGGTWGVPGGARHLEETPLAGALREAEEETGIDPAALRPRFAAVLDLGAWSYTTIVADAPTELPVSVADVESTALEWRPIAEVAALPLHPSFGAAWPGLRSLIAAGRRSLVVDVANVMGSRPDGWWRDRAGAADRLLDELAALAVAGLAVDDPYWPDAVAGETPAVVREWPDVVAVVEGAARGRAGRGPVRVVDAPASGDDAIVAEAGRLATDGRVTVVTADRELRDRVLAVGAEVASPRRLIDALP